MNFFQDLGYWGLFLGCFLAATIFPFSSDALFLTTLTFGGKITQTLFFGTLGNWLGGLTSYWVGYIGKWEWLEKWFKIKESTLQKQKQKVDKYGSWLALLTWVPFIGDVFAVALGFYKTNFYSSAFFMLVGKFLRFLFLVYIFMYMRDRLDWFI